MTANYAPTVLYYQHECIYHYLLYDSIILLYVPVCTVGTICVGIVHHSLLYTVVGTALCHYLHTAPAMIHALRSLVTDSDTCLLWLCLTVYDTV